VTALEKLRADPRVQRLGATLASRRAVEINDPRARGAAVAILIRLGGQDEPEIFFIQRALFEGDPWSGQIAFPGGREEPEDADLAATVARETFEETGFDLVSDATLIGVLDDLRPVSIRRPVVVVRPFVYLMPVPPAPVLSSEAADSFWVPLRVLLDRSSWRDTSVTAEGLEFSRFAFHHDGFVVWGMTERILSELLSIVG
jgi:8-oxo-dGTP pyrophosphatase MutT (NUDIX family)